MPTITTKKVRKLVWKRIICRYRVPRQLVSDNGTQFTYWRFEDFYKELRITQLFSLMEHPQTNGLAEAANKIILARLRKRLEQAKGLWVDKLYTILWAYHTMAHSLTQETPYRLVYGSNTVIPIELAEPSLRIITMTKESNELTQRAELNLVEEER